MNEKEWVESVIGLIQAKIKQREPSLRVAAGQKLPYAYEILSYTGKEPNVSSSIAYETDILVSEHLDKGEWKPRVIIEVKINSVTTHDVITYSQKAATHKNVHPYLRYGILIGNRKHYPLPGRLFRHGAYFDFMLSWQSFEPSAAELDDLVNLILAEVKASRDLQEIIFRSHDPKKPHYTYLHRPLRLKEAG